MKRLASLVAIALFVVSPLSGYSQDDDFPVLKGPYLGLKPPGMTPELFAPGIVPTEANEALYGFFHDGTLFLFDRTPAVYRMELKDGKWTPPNASPYQGKHWYNYYTTAPEGEQVYFAWKGSPGDRTSSADLNIWRVRKTGEGWTEPRKLPSPVNSMELDTYPKVTEDGTLYFFSNREGGFDLYVTFKKFDGTWTKPVNMGKGINTSAYDWVPHVTPDGKYFFFNSTRSGSWDIYWVDAKVIHNLKPEDLD